MKFFDSFWARIEQACYAKFPRIVEASIALAMILLALNISVEHVDFYHHAGSLASVPIQYVAGGIFATSTAQFISVLLPPAYLSRRLRILIMWVMTAELGIIAASVSSLVLWGWTWAIPGTVMMTAAVIRLRVKDGAEYNANDYHGGIRAAYNAGGASASLPVSESETPQRRRDSSQHRAFGS